jgi:hypothetical protein
MATAKKKTAPKKQVTKNPVPKPQSMPAKVVKPKPEATQAVTEPKSSKKDKIFALMQRPEGATIEEMVKVSDWQSHTVRGFLSMQKKAGKNVTSERIGDTRKYFIQKINL